MPPFSMLLDISAILISLTEHIQIVVRVSNPDRITVVLIGIVASGTLFGGARPHCHSSYCNGNEKNHLFHINVRV